MCPAVDFAAILAHERKKAAAAQVAAAASGKGGVQGQGAGSGGGGAAARGAVGAAKPFNELDVWSGRPRPALADLGDGLRRVRWCPSFLSSEDQAHVVRCAEAHGPGEWLRLQQRRLLNLGGVPHPSGMMAEALPPWLERPVLARLRDLEVFGRSVEPDQVLLNSYEAGRGIDRHNDGPLYQPVAAIVSLGSPAILRFHRGKRRSAAPSAGGGSGSSDGTVDSGGGDSDDGDAEIASVVLTPGSLCVFDEGAYEDAVHSIDDGVQHDTVAPTTLNAGDVGMSPGDSVPRGPRFSLTVRKVRRVALPAGECLADDDRREMARRRAWWASAVSEKK